MKSQKGRLFLVSAPSGAGKTTLLQHVIGRLVPDYALEKVVTYTTKQPRPGERQGIEYHFLTEEEFKSRIEEGFFVEYSTAYGSYYGFPKEVFELLLEGRHFIGIVDLAGAQSIKAFSEEAIFIGVRPPSQEALLKRLIDRAEDSERDIVFRLELAKGELDLIKEDFFDHIIVNDDLLEALDRLEEIIRQELTGTLRA